MDNGNRLPGKSRNRRSADVVALRKFLERSALGAAFAGLGSAPPLRGADQISLYVRQPAENGNHQVPDA